MDTPFEYVARCLVCNMRIINMFLDVQTYPGSCVVLPRGQVLHMSAPSRQHNRSLLRLSTQTFSRSAYDPQY